MVLVVVEPIDKLNSPPAALVNPTVNVAVAGLVAPTATDLTSWDDPLYPVKLKADLSGFITLNVDLKFAPVLIVRLALYETPATGSKVIVLLAIVIT